jgi:tape measure domain-containing protein
MAAITAELALEVSKFQGALQQAQSSLQGFRTRAQRQGDGLGRSMFGGLNRSAANVGEVMAGAIRGLNPAALLHRHFNDLGAVLGPAMAGAVAAVGVGKLVSGAISRAVSDEQMQVSFEVLVGNAAKAKETIASLRKLGAETPFEFPELADAGKKLIAFGEGADTVTDTLRRIGDISSGIQAPIGEIAEIYGKARVQGRLFAEDINQLTGRGIPVLQEFAKQLGVTDAEVKKMASDGKISFANLEQAFLSLTSEGGKFGGMMARQSRTVGGLWSTLKDTWGEVLLSFGQPVNDALRPLLDESIGLVGSLRDNAARIGAAVAGSMKAVVAFFKEFSAGEMGNLVLQSLSLGFKAGVNVLWRGLVAALAAAGQLLIEHFQNVITLFSVLATADFWKGALNAWVGVAKSFGAILLELLAKAIEQMKTIPGAGKLLGNADTALRGTAQTIRESSSGNFAQSQDQLTPAFEAARNRFGQTLANLGEMFGDAFTATKDLLDTSGEKSALGQAAARIQARQAATGAEAKAKEQAPPKAGTVGSSAPGPATAPTAAAAKAGAVRLPPGAFASAINLIMGRSANELILDETKKQTETQRQMVTQLRQINGKLTPRPASAAPAKPVLPVDTVARFA